MPNVATHTTRQPPGTPTPPNCSLTAICTTFDDLLALVGGKKSPRRPTTAAQTVQLGQKQSKCDPCLKSHLLRCDTRPQISQPISYADPIGPLGAPASTGRPTPAEFTSLCSPSFFHISHKHPSHTPTLHFHTIPWSPMNLPCCKTLARIIAKEHSTLFPPPSNLNSSGRPVLAHAHLSTLGTTSIVETLALFLLN
jgi:hypothetical protein